MAGNSGSGSNAAPEVKQSREAQKLVGEPFIASAVHVVRDGKTVEIKGGRLVSDSDVKLSKAEMEPLEKAGAIRPASLQDAQGSLAAVAAEEAADANRAAEAKRRELRNEQEAEIAEIRTKHDAARDAEIAALTEKHTKATDALNSKIASGKA